MLQFVDVGEEPMFLPTRSAAFQPFCLWQGCAGPELGLGAAGHWKVSIEGLGRVGRWIGYFQVSLQQLAARQRENLLTPSF